MTLVAISVLCRPPFGRRANQSRPDRARNCRSECSGRLSIEHQVHLHEKQFRAVQTGRSSITSRRAATSHSIEPESGQREEARGGRDADPFTEVQFPNGSPSSMPNPPEFQATTNRRNGATRVTAKWFERSAASAYHTRSSGLHNGPAHHLQATPQGSPRTLIVAGNS